MRDPKTAFLKASITPTSTICFRRQIALDVGCMPAQFRTGEDWLFFLRLTERGDFVFYREDLARLHRHDENLTHGRVIDRTTKEKLMGYRALLDGSAGISLTPVQSERVRGFYHQCVADWRYQLSRRGMRIYLSELWGGRCADRQHAGAACRPRPS